jgi:Ketopantoate reductase PanE/ApbA C terminal
MLAAKLEISPTLGELVRRAKRAGVDAPASSTLYAVINAQAMPLALLRGDRPRREDLAGGRLPRLSVREAPSRADLTVPELSRCATASFIETPSDR